LIRGVGCYRNGEEKGGTFSRFGFYPNSPTVAFYDLLAIGKADTGSGAFATGFDPLKNPKNTV